MTAYVIFKFRTSLYFNFQRYKKAQVGNVTDRELIPAGGSLCHGERDQHRGPVWMNPRFAAQVAAGTAAPLPVGS